MRFKHNCYTIDACLMGVDMCPLGYRMTLMICGTAIKTRGFRVVVT